MLDKINQFGDGYRFLSNSWKSPFLIDGKVYLTVEHYYQSKKARYKRDRTRIRRSGMASKAKALGKTVETKENWDEIKIDVLKRGLRAKFTQNESLRQKLLDTGDIYIEKRNKDGKNQLGEILMDIRKSLSR